MSQNIEQYLAALNSLKVEERLVAVEQLCRSRSPGVIPHIRRKLNDPDPRVRKTAMRGVTLLEGKSATGQILPFLNDPVPDLRIEAMAIVATLAPTEENGRKILRALKDPVETVRRKAIPILSRFPPSLVLEPLKALLDDDSAEVRLEALKAIKEIGRRSRESPRGEAAEGKAEVLFPTGSSQDDAPEAPLPPPQEEDEELLLLDPSFQAPSQEEIVEGVAVEEEDGEDFDDILDEVEETTASYYDAVEKIESYDEVTRLAGVRELAEVSERDRAHQNLLGLVLHDPSPTVREEAARSLGKLGVDGALDVLGKALHDAIPKVREAACEAIRKIGNRSALPSLKEALRDRERSVRIAAIEALGELADPSVSGELLSLLEEDDPMIRATAIAALGEIGDPSLMTRFETLLSEEPDELCRVAAAYALVRLGKERAMSHLLDTLEGGGNILAQVRCAYFLGKLGRRSALPALEKARRSRNRLLRQWAGDAIVRIEHQP
ncbi:MAG: hypothetical protein D6795_00175 [Deltaproteobacteria bacterium]|nr:MAG: hypothetical protein D6795_00175 [Deltaproteobacteria bacterium]